MCARTYSDPYTTIGAWVTRRYLNCRRHTNGRPWFSAAINSLPTRGAKPTMVYEASKPIGPATKWANAGCSAK